jgi:hypothetical protein
MYIAAREHKYGCLQTKRHGNVVLLFFCCVQFDVPNQESDLEAVPTAREDAFDSLPDQSQVGIAKKPTEALVNY